MVDCFKCEKEKNSSQLFDAISKEGIVKICKDCLDSESIPLVKKPTNIQLKEAEEPSSIYERLSSIAGIDAEEHMQKFHASEIKKKEALKRQEVSLRSLVDKNYKGGFKNLEISKSDLIDNFHWVIMRGRRLKKITHTQLAKEIAESESAVKMAEQGILPEDYYPLINKLESFLGIRILKKEAREKIEETSKQLEFDGLTAKSLTIANLKEMNSEKVAKVLKKGSKPVGEIEEEFILNEDIDMDDYPEFVKK